MAIQKMGFYEAWVFKTGLIILAIGFVVCALSVSVVYAVSKILV